MRGLLRLGIVAALVSVTSVFGVSNFEHFLGEVITRDTVTVTENSATYGSYNRACSTTAFTALDSGAVVTVVSGIADLNGNDLLYVSLDTAGGDSDTGLAQAVINVCRGVPQIYEQIATHFEYTHVLAVDSNVSVPARVLTLASGDGASVPCRKIAVQVYVIAEKAN